MAEILGIPVVVDDRMPPGYAAIADLADPRVPPVVLRLPEEASDG